MAGCGRVGGAPSRAAGAAARCRRAGLVAGGAGQHQRARKKGGEATGPNPTDRGKPGTKRHLVVDAQGTPLGVTLSGANRHDSMALAATLDAVPGMRTGRRGRPRRRPDKLHADKAYDHRRCRDECRARSIKPRIARRAARDRDQPAARPSSVGGRAHAGLARPLPSPRCALRATRRPSPRPHHPGVRPHLSKAGPAVLSLILSLRQQLMLIERQTGGFTPRRAVRRRRSGLRSAE